MSCDIHIQFAVDGGSNVASAALTSHKRKPPAHFAYSHVMQTVGDRPHTDFRDGFRQNVSFPRVAKVPVSSFKS